MAAAAARKPVLEQEAIRLRKRQELQQKELFLQQQREELELDTKIAQAAAEERTYSEIDAVKNANPDHRDKGRERSLFCNSQHSRIVSKHDQCSAIPVIPSPLPGDQHNLSVPLNPHARAGDLNTGMPTSQANVRTSRTNVHVSLGDVPAITVILCLL